MKITEFQGEYRFLSNFWRSPVSIMGIVYPTAEHAYQAAKTTDLNIRKQIARLETPGQAKRFGRQIAIRPDWERIKLQSMEFIVRKKFEQNRDVRYLLAKTGNMELEEGNRWNDRFWGVCNGSGQNHLGKILMKIRAEINEPPFSVPHKKQS